MWRSGRGSVALVTAALLSSGCGGDRASLPADGPADPRPVLRIATTDGVVGIDTASGRIAFRAGAAVADPTGAVLYRAEPSGSDTVVVGLDGETGAVRSRHHVTGAMEVRTVGAGGGSVVLTPPRPPGSAPYLPSPKSRSTIAVLHGATGSVQSVELEGNYEPEALASDGGGVFVVEFNPPLAPDRYRVRRLDLVNGAVADVFSPDKELQQDMRGSARRQVMARDGRRLYTLYNLVAGDGRRRAFVHVLDLHEQWAHCIDLPGSLATGSEETMALALGEDGRRLFVLDGELGQVAEVDTARLSVAEPTPLPAEVLGTGPLHAATAAGRVYAASGRHVVPLGSPADGVRGGRLPAGAGVVDLVAASDGSAFVSTARALWRLGPGTAGLRRLSLPAGTMSAVSPPGAGSRSALRCSC